MAKYSELLGVRVTPAQYKKVVLYCKKNETTVTKWLREVIDTLENGENSENTTKCKS